MYLEITKIKIKKAFKKNINKKILMFIVFILAGTIIFISGRYTGFRFKISFHNVYELRSEAQTFKIPIILGYIYSASKSINPLLLAYYLTKKEYKYSLLIFLIQILSFSINGSKTILTTTLLAVIFNIFYKKKYLKLLPWIFISFNLLGVLELYVLKTYTIINYFIRRVFFVPNLLNYYYYDFFKKNTPDYLKQSFLRYLNQKSEYPPIDNMIGDIYFNKPEMGANNGLFSDAYANFGIFGIFIMPLAIIFILKILDSCAEGLEDKILLTPAITLAFIFISSFYFTILLTHGLIGLCITLYFLEKQKKFKKYRRRI